MNTETTIWSLITAGAIVAILVLLKQEGYFDSDDQIIFSSADELHPLAKTCLN